MKTTVDKKLLDIYYRLIESSKKVDSLNTKRYQNFLTKLENNMKTILTLLIMSLSLSVFSSSKYTKGQIDSIKVANLNIELKIDSIRRFHIQEIDSLKNQKIYIRKYKSSFKKVWDKMQDFNSNKQAEFPWNGCM